MLLEMKYSCKQYSIYIVPLISMPEAKETSAHKSIQCTEVSFMRLVSRSYCSTYIPWFAYFSA